MFKEAQNAIIPINIFERAGLFMRVQKRQDVRRLYDVFPFSVFFALVRRLEP